MKKIYMTPTARVVGLKPTALICLSGSDVPEMKDDIWADPDEAQD